MSSLTGGDTRYIEAAIQNLKAQCENIDKERHEQFVGVFGVRNARLIANIWEAIDTLEGIKKSMNS